MKPRAYRNLEQFMGYFGQNYAYWGETVPEIVSAFKRECSPKDCEAVLGDIARFLRSHPHDLDAAFDASVGNDFDAKLWGHTTASFLAKVDRLLREPRSTLQ
jgi:hypothetical protein